MKRRQLLRLGALLAIAVALFAIGRAYHFSMDGLRHYMATAGAVGVAAFTGGLALGQLLHLPGLLFVAAAVASYGRLGGGLVCFGAAIVAVTIVFLFARAVGGAALEEIEKPFVKKLLLRLEQQPIRVVILLRVLLFLNPGLSMALALTRVRVSHFFLGTAIGLVPPLIVTTLFLDWLLKYLA